MLHLQLNTNEMIPGPNTYSNKVCRTGVGTGLNNLISVFYACYRENISNPCHDPSKQHAYYTYTAHPVPKKVVFWI